MAVEKGLNVAKGKIFELKQPVDLAKLKKKSAAAARSDSSTDVDAMLSLLQTAFAALEYIRDNRFGVRLNNVYNVASGVMSETEEAFGNHNYYLQGRWEEWNEDHFNEAMNRARRWARQAIQTARAPWVEAHNSDRQLANYERVMQVLDDFEDLIAEIRMPIMFHTKIPNPDNGEAQRV